MQRISDPLVLVNGDDFGFSSAVNRAIIVAFRSGLIDTCTIMANAPAFEEACEAAHANGFAERIGLHFVLDEGVPLTEQLRREPRFCGLNGHMLSRRRGKLIWLSSPERCAVAAEFRAQVARCRSFGLPLTHFDSHHHVHEEPGIISVALPAMREQCIGFVRPMQNLRRCRTLIRRIYTYAFNTNLTRQRIAWTHYFGAVSDYLHFVSLWGAPPPDTTIELMVHPILGPDGAVIDKDSTASLSKSINSIRNYHTLADRCN
jgi:chitin disaccharide deacetylase